VHYQTALRDLSVHLPEDRSGVCLDDEPFAVFFEAH